MQQKVTVTLTGTQRTAGGPAEKTTVKGPGSWAREGKKHRLSFREGESGVFCDAVLTEQELRFYRRGEVSSKMVFRPGEKTVCLYETTAGTLELPVETIKIGLRESPGRVDEQLRRRLPHVSPAHSLVDGPLDQLPELLHRRV